VVLSAAGNFPAFSVGVPMVLVGGVRSACAQEPLLSPLTLDHVDIRVSNVARSAGFYRDAAESLGNRPLLRMINHEENLQTMTRRHHERAGIL
jgi:hypothetical protein